MFILQIVIRLYFDNFPTNKVRAVKYSPYSTTSQELPVKYIMVPVATSKNGQDCQKKAFGNI